LLRKITAALAATFAVAVPAAQSSPHRATTCEKAYGVRAAVVKKHGKRAPGRNICRLGVRHSGGSTTKATVNQKRRYLSQLRLLNVAAAAVPPHLAPAGAMTARGTPSTNSMVNPQCESGGNPQAVSPAGYWGKYQFDRQTWTRFGGSPSSYGSASEAEQDAVAGRVTYDAWPNC
jgi:hypothetical protein